MYGATSYNLLFILAIYTGITFALLIDSAYNTRFPGRSVADFLGPSDKNILTNPVISDIFSVFVPLQ